MQSKFIIVLLGLCTFASGSHLPTSAQQYLSKFALESRAAIEDNPSRSIECFGDYMDEITEITNVYEGEYAKCSADSEVAMTALDATFAGDRDDLTQLAASSCQLFTDCNAKESALDFFTCYTSAGNDASKTSYAVSTKADQYAKDVNQKQAQIIYDKDQCNSACKVKYEKSADASWTTLQSCINAPPSARADEAVHSNVMRQALRKH